MRTKSVSFPDPAKLRSLFGPCYAYAILTSFFLMKSFVLLPIVTQNAGIQNRLTSSSKYFSNRKCCHPQLSDLVIRLVFFRESSRKIINKLTSRLPSCESSIPGRFALFECNSNDVRICKKISQESCHQEIMKPKSDI